MRRKGHAATRLTRHLLLVSISVPLLAGCADFGDFLGDTATLGANPNRPLGDAENMRRVQGVDVPSGPLLPEPGNVWPTGVEAAPTLQDLEKEGNQGQQAPPAPSPDITPYLPDHRQPRPATPPRGSSTPPGSAQPDTTTSPPPPSGSASPGTLPAPSPVPPTVLTPSGPQAPATGNGNYQQLAPGGGGNSPGGIVIPNGNGTSTLIRPDGTVTTVPTPK